MIKVLKAGFGTTIQDKGRVGFSSIGVPVSGVMDAYSAGIANQILNNSLNESVLEIIFGGVALAFLAPTILCVSGANVSIKINEKEGSLNTQIAIKKNDILTFKTINLGIRSYLAVQGGFITEEVLGSKSFFKNITPKTMIKKNDLLDFPLLKSNFVTSNSSLKINRNHFETKKITCFEGPEFYLLNEHQKQQLLSRIFTISKDNNRMGYRLEEGIENKLPSILTSAVLPGTVQLTPSGKIIVLMRDCQVTGGYPRVLQLTNNAINILAQKSTNDEIAFNLCSF